MQDWKGVPVYYATCWVTRKYTKTEIFGWTLHVNREDAINNTTLAESSEAFRMGIYLVSAQNENIERDLFISGLSGKYVFINEAEPAWLVGAQTIEKSVF